MLKRGSGTRKLPVFSNMNSRTARVELLKHMHNNNNILNNNIHAINVFENNYTPNIVSATPSPAPADVHHAVRATSPALAASAVRHIPGATRQTYNVRNTAQPHHASVFGKPKKLELLKMRRSSRRRGSRSSRRRGSRRN